MFNIISHQRNANKNYNKTSQPTYQIVKIKKMKIPNAGENSEKADPSYIASKMLQPLLSVWQSVTKLNLHLPFCSAIALLNMYSTEMRTQLQN